MRTENQIKRKLIEFEQQKKSMQQRLTDPSLISTNGLQNQIEQLDDKIMLLEWVLNEPSGSYHQ